MGPVIKLLVDALIIDVAVNDVFTDLKMIVPGMGVDVLADRRDGLDFDTADRRDGLEFDTADRMNGLDFETTDTRNGLDFRTALLNRILVVQARMPCCHV